MNVYLSSKFNFIILSVQIIPPPSQKTDKNSMWEHHIPNLSDLVTEVHHENSGTGNEKRNIMV